MIEKNVTYLVSSSPFQTLNNYEALRSTIGLFNHEVSIIWIDDGVFFTLKTTNDDRTLPFLRLVQDMEINLYVFIDDLSIRNIDICSVNDIFIPINEKVFNQIIKYSDVIMSF
jgi:sulfur transfer complex TusBCD TusB component (DsrH family)